MPAGRSRRHPFCFLREDPRWPTTTTSIFPAAYDGRWPHIHFEVHASLDDATNATDKLRTSQLALGEDVCTEVYAAEGYVASLNIPV